MDTPIPPKVYAWMSRQILIRLLACAAGCIACVGAAGAWPERERLFFWLMIGCWVWLVASFARLKARFHAGEIGPSN